MASQGMCVNVLCVVGIINRAFIYPHTDVRACAFDFRMIHLFDLAVLLDLNLSYSSRSHGRLAHLMSRRTSGVLRCGCLSAFAHSRRSVVLCATLGVFVCATVR